MTRPGTGNHKYKVETDGCLPPSLTYFQFDILINRQLDFEPQRKIEEEARQWLGLTLVCSSPLLLRRCLLPRQRPPCPARAQRQGLGQETGSKKCEAWC